MKKLLFSVAMFALTLAAVPRTNGAEVSVDFFYTNLSGGGWIEVEDYGYGWQPEVAVSDPDWRPYADGYWAYTDYGWTWVAYEDFGWATYHYGLWARLEDYGWVWFPGSDLEWGPAWVSWRTGGDQIGWAPLPPRGPGIVYAGGSIGARVDIEFDIGPAYYNFVDVRYIGEPVLRSHIYAPSYNVTYINQTVNVTNITVKNKTVYNYGPDVNVLAQRSARPIQRLKIERQANVDVAAAAKGGALTKVQGDKLVIAAPQRIQKSAKPVAPPTVKTKVAKNKIERGWKGVGDENAKTQLKQKMQTEDPKKIPPPGPATGAAQAPAGAAQAPGANAPAPAATAAPGAADQERGKFGRKGERVKPGAAAGMPPGAEGEKMGRGRGKQKGRMGEQPGVEPGGPPGPEGTATDTAADRPERGKHKGRLQREREMNQPPAGGMAPEGAETGPAEGKHPGKRGKQNLPETAPPTGGPPTGAAEKPPGGKQKGRRLEPGEAPGAGGPPPGAMGERRGKHRQEGVNRPPQGGPPAGQPGEPKVKGGKKKKGEKEEPPPGPPQ